MSLPYQKSSTYSEILFFPVGSTEKDLCLCYYPIRNFRFPFLKRETPVLRGKDQRQETQNIKLCLALHWLFDVNRFLTL